MGCSPNDEVKNETIDRLIPEDSEKVDIVVEEPYKLTQTTAYGNLDSFSMREGPFPQYCFVRIDIVLFAILFITDKIIVEQKQD